jgi:hypothetical protein
MTATAKSGGAPSVIDRLLLEESFIWDAEDERLPGVTVRVVKRVRLVGTLSNWYLMTRGRLTLDIKGVVEGMNCKESSTASQELALIHKLRPEILARGWFWFADAFLSLH